MNMRERIMEPIARRSLLSGAAALTFVSAVPSRAASRTMLIHKDPNCGCCTGWAAHVRAGGFETRIHESSDLSPIKARLAVPSQLASCHTAEIDGYVIEGHVPASAIRRLLSELPGATGLAVPRMPIGSPGMEAPGTTDDTYDVILFGPSLQRVYARFRGAKEID
jgi:hypothetical protein